MGLLNAVYMKVRAFILFIERTDEEFLPLALRTSETNVI